jgi:predicted component of type VI protein secretion system
MPPQLVALTEGPSILLDKPILLFGRNPECDIQIDSRKISRRHCCLAQVNDYLVVRDLGSTNGIRINGVRVLEGKLRGGDELTIGSHRYQIRWDPHAEPGGMRRPPSHHQKPEPAPARGTNGSIPNIEDELLEACDEPVPLVEPGAGTQRSEPLHRSPAAPPVMPMLSLDATDDPALRENLYIPEEVDLAPVSEVRPPVKPPPRSKSEPTSLD